MCRSSAVHTYCCQRQCHAYSCKSLTTCVTVLPSFFFFFWLLGSFEKGKRKTFLPPFHFVVEMNVCSWQISFGVLWYKNMFAYTYVRGWLGSLCTRCWLQQQTPFCAFSSHHTFRRQPIQDWNPPTETGSCVVNSKRGCAVLWTADIQKQKRRRRKTGIAIGCDLLNLSTLDRVPFRIHNLYLYVCTLPSCA